MRPPLQTVVDQIIAIHGDDPDEWDEDTFIEYEDYIPYLHLECSSLELTEEP